MKKIIRITAALAALIMLAACCFAAFADESSETSEPSKVVKPPEITSGNMVVIRSVDTGQILLDTSAGEKVAPTVSAKLVAAMVAFDLIDNIDKKGLEYTVPGEALLSKNIGQNGDISCPMLGLKSGDVFTPRQLLTATLVSAANDACYALAYNVMNGDVSEFVDRMNEKAASLGCTDTLFTNPVGLNDGKSYTTARDVSLIAAGFYKYNVLLSISSLPSYVLGKSTLQTKNYLLSKTLTKDYYFAGVKGMIAGQSRMDGGYCLITAGENEGLGYVFVVMEAPGEMRSKDGTRTFPENNAYADIHKTFKWALTSFGYLLMVKAGEVIGTLPVSVGSDNTDTVNYIALEEVDMLVPTGLTAEDIVREPTLYYDELEAPVEKDKVVGKLGVYYEGELLASVPLVTAAAVDRSPLLSLFGRFKAFLTSPTVKTIIRILIIIVICYLVLLLALKIYSVVSKANKAAQKAARDKRREGIDREKSSGDGKKAEEDTEKRQKQG